MVFFLQANNKYYKKKVKAHALTLFIAQILYWL